MWLKEQRQNKQKHRVTPLMLQWKVSNHTDHMTPKTWFSFTPLNCDLLQCHVCWALVCCSRVMLTNIMSTWTTTFISLPHVHKHTQTLQSGLVPASTDARWHSSLTSPFSYSFGSSLSWDMRWAFVESFAPFSLSLAGLIISALRWAYFLTGLRHN